MAQRKSDGKSDTDVPLAVDLLRKMTEAFYALGQDFATQHALHPTDVQALMHLIEADESGTPATPGRIGEALGLASGSVTGLVDRLERAGHVRRTRDSHDRRRVIIVPSTAMLQAGRDYWGSADDRVAEALRHYQPAEITTIERFLTEMTAIATSTTTPGLPHTDNRSRVGD